MRQYLIIGLRNIRKHYWQAILAIIGISLAVSFSVGINKIVGTVNSDFIEQSRGPSLVDLSIYNKQSYWFSASEITPTLNNNPYIQQYSGIAMLSVSGSSISLPLDQGESTREFENELFLIYGIDPTTFPDWKKIPMFIGIKSVSENRILISKYLALKYELLTNQSFFIENNEIIVNGVFDNYVMPKIGMQNSKNMIIVPIDLMRDFFGKTDDEVTTIVLTVSDFSEVELAYQQLTSEIGDQYTVVIEKSLSFADKLTLSSFGTTMGIIILITIIVEFIFLLNLFLILANYLQSTIGLLKSLGCSKKQLSLIFLIEITIYGIVGSIMGLFFGDFVATKIMEFLLEAEGLSISAIQPLDFFDVLYALQLGWGVSILAAVYPLGYLLKLPITKTLHERSHLLTSLERDAITWKTIAGIGTLFLIMGTILSWQAAKHLQLDIRIDNSLAGAIFFIFSGLFILQLLTLWVFPTIFNLIAKSTSSMLLAISTRTLTRYRVKSMAAVATNAIAVAFVLTIIIMTSSLMYQVPTWYQQSYPNVDLILEAQNNDPFSSSQLDFLRKNAQNFSINSFTHLRYQKSVISKTSSDGARTTSDLVHVFGVDPNNFVNFSLPLLEGRPIKELEFSNNNSSQIPAIITDHLAKRFGLEVGSTVKLKLLDFQVEIQIQVLGVMQSPVFTLTSSTFQVFIDENALQNIVEQEIGIKYLLIKLDKTELAKDVEPMLSEAFPNILNIYSTRDILARMQQSLNRQNTFLKALTYQAILMAALTQFVTIMLSAERTRHETGIMRTLGLDKKGVKRVFLFEGIQIAIIATILGWLDGIVASVLIAEYLRQIVAPVTLQLPVIEMSTWTLLYYGMVVLATVYPGWRTSRIPVIRALELRPQIFPTKSPISIDIKAISGYIRDNYFRPLSTNTWHLLLLTGVAFLVVNLITSAAYRLLFLFGYLFMTFTLVNTSVFKRHLPDIIEIEKEQKISTEEMIFQRNFQGLLNPGKFKLLVKEIVLITYIWLLLLFSIQLIESFFLMITPPQNSSNSESFFMTVPRLVTPALLWLLLLPIIFIFTIMLTNAIMNGLITNVLGEKLSTFITKQGLVLSGLKMLQLASEKMLKDVFYDDTAKITIIHVLSLALLYFLASVIILFLPILAPLKIVIQLLLEAVIGTGMVINLSEEITRKYLLLASE